MDFKSIFKTKARNKSVYPSLARSNGLSASYTTTNYKGISKEGYMANWIIFRCMQEIIRAATQLNFVVRQYKGDDVEDILNHPIEKLIKKPNKLYGKNELIKRAIAFYFLGGEAPFQKLMAGGNPKELYVYRPDQIKVRFTGDVDNPYTDIRYKERIPIEPKDFMLWKNFNPLDEWDGMGHGMAFLEPILRNGDLLNEMINWNTALLQNGGSLSGVFIMDPSLSDEDNFERTRKELEINHTGTENPGKWLLLDGISQYITTGTTPKDMDWLQGKESVMKDICIGIGVDPILIGFNESASYNNKNEAEKGLYTKLVIPLMQELADQLTIFLNLGENEFIAVDYDHIPVLQEDMKELYDKINKANDMTINEKRQARGLETVEGGDIIAPTGSYAIVDGKVYLPMNLISIDDNTSKTVSEGKEDKSFMY